jgi:hypothetical protein
MVAKRFNVEMQHLKRWNPRSGQALKPGQMLTVYRIETLPLKWAALSAKQPRSLQRDGAAAPFAEGRSHNQPLTAPTKTSFSKQAVTVPIKAQAAWIGSDLKRPLLLSSAWP